VDDPDQKYILTCGSGITASVLFVALHKVGIPLDRLSIYDGSWTEWVRIIIIHLVYIVEVVRLGQ
jgi:3-mercaptopyruvate sulfurtransferase SseA